MNMEQVQRMQSMPVQNQESGQLNGVSSNETQQSFKNMLSEAVENVNEKQIASKDATEKMARGENIDLHDVMITGQEANLALQTTVEVRDQIVNAYEEIMRMQV